MEKRLADEGWVNTSVGILMLIQCPEGHGIELLVAIDNASPGLWYQTIKLLSFVKSCHSSF